MKSHGQASAREPLDPSRGMLYSMGGPIQHLTFAMVGLYIYFVKESLVSNDSCGDALCTSQNTFNGSEDKLLESIEADGDKWKFNFNDNPQASDNVLLCYPEEGKICFEHIFMQLISMHVVCFVCQLGSPLLQRSCKRSYFHDILTLFTVLYYELIVLKYYSEVIKVEKIAEAINCLGLSFKYRHAWMYIEVFAFLVNMIQLMLYLVGMLDK